MFNVLASTENELLVPVDDPAVCVAVIVNVPTLEIVTPCDESTPFVNDADVPLPDDKVPVDVILTVPEKLFVPELQILFSASCAETIIVNNEDTFWDGIFPPPDFSTKNLFNVPGKTVKEGLVNPGTVPSVTVNVVISAFFNVVVSTVVETPDAKLTEVMYEGAVSPLFGPE